MLKKSGIVDRVAREGANIRKGYWRCARNPITPKPSLPKDLRRLDI